MREPRLKVPKPKKAATGDESKSPSKKKRQAAASSSPNDDDESNREKVASSQSKSHGRKQMNPENVWVPGGSKKYGIRAGAPFFNNDKEGERGAKGGARKHGPGNPGVDNKQFETPDGEQPAQV